eukprot:scaffold196624_cov33-Tisochrysis_lutea.AAC.2
MARNCVALPRIADWGKEPPESATTALTQHCDAQSPIWVVTQQGSCWPDVEPAEAWEALDWPRDFVARAGMATDEAWKVDVLTVRKLASAQNRKN